MADMVQLPPPGSFLDPQRLISALGIVQGMHVADLGCGSGFFPSAFARAVGTDGVVTAVDVRQEPLDAVSARAEAAGMKNISVVRADLEVLGGTKIPDDSQDVSFLANVLFQSQKKDAIIKEAARILKPGGHLALIEWKKGVQGFGPPDELRTAEEDLRALATQAGLRPDRTIDAGSFHVGMLFTK